MRSRQKKEEKMQQDKGETSSYPVEGEASSSSTQNTGPPQEEMLKRKAQQSNKGGTLSSVSDRPTRDLERKRFRDARLAAIFGHGFQRRKGRDEKSKADVTSSFAPSPHTDHLPKSANMFPDPNVESIYKVPGEDTAKIQPFDANTPHGASSSSPYIHFPPAGLDSTSDDVLKTEWTEGVHKGTQTIMKEMSDPNALSNTSSTFPHGFYKDLSGYFTHFDLPHTLTLLPPEKRLKMPPLEERLKQYQDVYGAANSSTSLETGFNYGVSSAKAELPQPADSGPQQTFDSIQGTGEDSPVSSLSSLSETMSPQTSCFFSLSNQSPPVSSFLDSSDWSSFDCAPSPHTDHLPGSGNKFSGSSVESRDKVPGEDTTKSQDASVSAVASSSSPHNHIPQLVLVLCGDTGKEEVEKNKQMTVKEMLPVSDFYGKHSGHYPSLHSSICSPSSPPGGYSQTLRTPDRVLAGSSPEAFSGTSLEAGFKYVSSPAEKQSYLHSPKPHSTSFQGTGDNRTLTRAQSLPDLQLNCSCEQFTPDITADEEDETYRFQCSSPGLYQCSVTGLVFHMEREGDLVYRTLPWNRKLLSQHHKQPAGPLFDIKCEQQSVCQLLLPHCEIHSTGGADFLSVAHLDEENIEFIVPHKITETHVIINITRFSAFGNVKDEDSPPDPVRALVLIFFRPPADPDPTSLLNVLLLPKNVLIPDVVRYRKKLIGYECYIEKPPDCKLQPQQEYSLSTCPEDDSVLVEPTTAEFYSDNYDNYSPSFQVTLEKTMSHLKLILRDNNSSKSVWERRVCLSSSRVQRSCGQSALNLPPNQRLFEIRSSFIAGISGPVLKSLLDKLLEKTVMIDSEVESADEMRNRGDKARFVIDTVRNKGEAASSEMMEALCDLDPFFSDHLGLT